MTILQKMPLEERPRERLMQHGVDALSLPELLAILLGTGTRGKSVLQLAQEMLSYFGDLNGLLEASVEELMEIKGVGRAKAIQLKAAFGIAMRRTRGSPPASIHRAFDAFIRVKEEMSAEKQEVLMIILRDVKGKATHQEIVARGTLSEVIIHPREIFYPAVRHKAHSLIIAHNHPSGDPTPSQADLQLTRVLLESSHIMGIGLDDHLIIGKDSFVSLRERGLMGKSQRY
jgi:DNA repair protein RadC